MKSKKETKAIFVVISGFVSLPDEDGNVEDILPYKKYASGKNEGACKRDSNHELEWEYTEYEALPSKVGHIVASGKLVLKDEFERFYPAHYEKYLKDNPPKEDENEPS